MLYTKAFNIAYQQPIRVYRYKIYTQFCSVFRPRNIKPMGMPSGNW